MTDAPEKIVRANLKVSQSVWDWIRDEQHKLLRATGKEPTQSQVIEMLIAERERSDLVQSPYPELPLIPKSLIPVIDWLVNFFATKGPPEAEMLKDSMRMLAAQRMSDLKRRKASRENAS